MFVVKLKYQMILRIGHVIGSSKIEKEKVLGLSLFFSIIN